MNGDELRATEENPIPLSSNTRDGPTFAGLTAEDSLTQRYYTADWTVEEGEDVNSESEPDCVGDEHELLDEVGSNIDYILEKPASPHRPEPPRRISVHQMLSEQHEDELCKTIRDAINTGHPSLFFDDGVTGVLHRRNGDEKQVFVPRSLRQRLLHMAHYSAPGGHPGGRKMYKTIRRSYYWPALPVEVYRVVRTCHECTKERVRARKRSTLLKLFPTADPLEDVAMDLLGQFIEKSRGHKHLLVITDRFTKLVLEITMKTTRNRRRARIPS